MSKFTAGPWHRNIPPATKYTTVWSGRNKHVAHVVTHGLSPEEVEANISLIAAAPELAEALRLLLADVADYPTWQRPCRAVDVARAALAKAGVS